MWTPHLLELFLKTFQTKRRSNEKKQNGLADAVKKDNYRFMAIANMTNVLCYIEMNQDQIDRKIICWNNIHVTLMNFGVFGIIVIYD